MNTIAKTESLIFGIIRVEKVKVGVSMKVQIKKKAENRIKKGYPLIQKEDLAQTYAGTKELAGS